MSDKRIYKYTVTPRATTAMPTGAVILSVGQQGDDIVCWAIVNPDAPKVERGYYLHLRTQRDQPYGSVRRCCEVCGTMVWPERQSDTTPHWTDDLTTYAESSNRCELRPRDSL